MSGMDFENCDLFYDDPDNETVSYVESAACFEKSNLSRKTYGDQKVKN